MNRWIPQWIVLVAVILPIAGVLLLGLLDAPDGAASSGAPEVYLQDIERSLDHISPTELSRELMAARGDVAVVDLRPPDQFAAWHLPGAVNRALPELAADAAVPANSRLVVLCSSDAVHAGQAFVELRRRGHANIRVLDGGLDAFVAQVLTPSSVPAPAAPTKTPPESAALALRRAFFLGDPNPNPQQTWATDPERLESPTVVSAGWLHEHLGSVAVVDARESVEDYSALHVPGAVHLRVPTLREKVGSTELFLQPPAHLADRFSALGITRAMPVVIYVEDKMQDATLAALAFLRCGHRALAILDGGLLRWATERRPLTGDVTSPTPARYEPLPAADDFTVTADEVAARLADGRTVVLDVRPPDFFRGEKSTEARPGHIPGAVNRPFVEDLAHGPDGTWFRSRSELDASYRALGLRRGDPVVVSCRTGHQASESWFVLRWLLGYPDVRWYNGSWTEWASRADLPAETGAGRGSIVR